MSSVRSIRAEVSIKSGVSAECTVRSGVQAECTIGRKVIVHDIVPEVVVYEGQTRVEPDFNGVTLETDHKYLLDDITVNPIQVESVSNIEGGRTVYIGGII